MVDIPTIITGILSIIGGATVLLRAVAPFTKTKADDHVLKYLESFLKAVSLDTTAGEKDHIKVKLNR